MVTSLEDPLFNQGDQAITGAHLLSALRSLGIASGDTVMVHSELIRFGRVPAGLLRDRAAWIEGIVAVLLEAVGPAGTLIMPALTADSLRTGVFDPLTTPAETGILCEHFRKRPDVVRTLHPTHSMAIHGPAADRFNDLPADPFGDGSAFDRAKRMGGKLLFLGVDFQWCTFNHHIEDAARVPYRRRVPVDVIIRTHGIDRKMTAVRFTKSDRFRIDFTRFRKVLVDRGILRESRLGQGYLAVADMTRVFEAGLEQLRKDQYFFLRVTPLHTHLIRRAKQWAGKLRRSLGWGAHS